jgi:acetylornithine deacetylase
MFRTVGPSAELRALLEPLRGLVDLDVVLDVPAVTLATVPGFDVAVFPFTTDIPFLDRWGTPLLFGPGSILVAHTDHEHVSVAELDAAADRYVRLANTLLAKNMGDNEMKNEE